ncbi:hypothetical protein E3N88_03609 [Mikania micrantha]|uniref:Uncharacterized protein n=1 Tax=Mikania micrantha TaxID=192012 RepID=A0A5N6Q7E9_9ASTR|nr:hypothetical protein E3N88_03609 [Mikania micrantha]
MGLLTSNRPTEVDIAALTPPHRRRASDRPKQTLSFCRTLRRQRRVDDSDRVGSGMVEYGWEHHGVEESAMKEKEFHDSKASNCFMRNNSHITGCKSQQDANHIREE